MVSFQQMLVDSELLMVGSHGISGMLQSLTLCFQMDMVPRLAMIELAIILKTMERHGA